MKSVIIIGGGIIGLCSAYYLAKEGATVTVIDKSDMTDGCSYGNAGMIVPSHIIPMAQPGVIHQGIKWMFNAKSPFYIKPALSLDLLAWLIQFYKNSNQEHVNKSMVPLRNLSFFSKELYREFAQSANEFGYQEKGLLMLYNTNRMGEEEIKIGKVAEELGIEVDFLNHQEVSKLENGLKVDALGAVHYKSDAHLSPNHFIAFLKAELNQMGVKLISNCSLIDFKVSEGKIVELLTNQGNFKADEFVISAGSWSVEVAKKLGVKLHILPGKGYSFNAENLIVKPTIPTILCEGKVAVTPLGETVRFGGTLEITNNNDTQINIKRLQGIVEKVNQFYPDIKVDLPEKEKVWHGFRPCTPTGLPIIEKSKKIKNLTIATGHAMMGLSLAPASGKLVSELLMGKKTSVDITEFRSC
ncbi:MAG: amino acid dehydrogenase [Bacteroidetes bacterium HGW-Bacteroidetes-18]|nr:MAG: amino acid dehydrogenase [Bacteroidetes bacterium HGW-Bacteroidetes-18]